MHTRICPGLLFRPFFKSVAGRRPVLVVGLCVLLVGGTAGDVQPALGQVGFPGAPDEQGVNFRVYPTDFWGPRAGFGVGAGVVGHNLARQHDQWLLTAAPARYEQVGTVSFASADPRRARRYVLVDARVLHSDRDWVGPWALDRSAVRGRVRVGQTFLDRRLLVQPHLTALFMEASDVRARSGFSTDRRADTPSPTPDANTGLRTGLSLRFDTRRNDTDDPQRGIRLQGTWDRYVPLDGADRSFHQVDLDAYGVLPLHNRHRLLLRLSTTLTTSEASVPLVMQPTLGGTVVPGWKRAEFVGPDRLLGSLLYRFPLLTITNVTVVEGHVGGHLANVYRDLGAQFTPKISFDEEIDDGETPPLRPTVSTGIRVQVPFRPRAAVDLAVGLGPTGVTAARVSFTRRLQALHHPHHSSAPLR